MQHRVMVEDLEDIETGVKKTINFYRRKDVVEVLEYFIFEEDKGGAEMSRTSSIKQERSNVQSKISSTPQGQKEVRHDSGYVLRWDADETLDRDDGKDRRVLQSPNGMGRESWGKKLTPKK